MKDPGLATGLASTFTCAHASCPPTEIDRQGQVDVMVTLTLPTGPVEREIAAVTPVQGGGWRGTKTQSPGIKHHIPLQKQGRLTPLIDCEQHEGEATHTEGF